MNGSFPPPIGGAYALDAPTSGAAGTDAARGSGAGSRGLRIWWVAVGVVWAVLTISGLTLSSMSTYVSDPATDSGVIAGQAQPLRSDEYARLTPLMLGVQTGQGTDFLTPLTNQPFVASSMPSGVVWLESLVFPEMGLQRAAGGWLPDAAIFSFAFWFLPAVCALLLPYLLMAMGARLSIALAGTGLVILTPVVAWWSLRPFQSLLPGVVAAACWVGASRMQQRRKRGWIPAVVLGLIAGLALARIPWSYPPWSLPLSGAVLVLTLCYLIGSRRDVWRLLPVVAVSSGVAMAATAGILIGNDAAFSALTNTVYPGQRRVDGEALPLGRSFGAPFDGIFQTSPTYRADNPTEWSGSWTYAVLLWVALAAARWWRADRGLRVRLVIVGAMLAVGCSWFCLDWPTWLGESVPVLNLIPPTRMAAIWGLIITLAVVPLIGTRLRWYGLLALGAASALLLYGAGWDLKRQLVPDLSPVTIVLVTAIGVTVVVLLATGRPRLLSIALVLGVIAAGSTMYRVNPLQAGLLPLRDSKAADQVLALAGDRRPESGLWAVDTPALSALLAANGVPALSGEQWSGPSAQWRLLDPTGQYQGAWNRGVSKVVFDWTPGVETPVIGTAGADGITVRVDPCAPALDAFDVRWVVSLQPLEGACLTEVDRGAWQQTPFIIYARAGGG